MGFLVKYLDKSDFKVKFIVVKFIVVFFIFF